MKQSIDLRSIQKTLSLFLGRFHAIIFFVILSGLLIGCIVVILSIINLSGTSDPGTDAQVDQSFDETTIDRLNQLQGTDSDKEFQLPDGRINPLAE